MSAIQSDDPLDIAQLNPPSADVEPTADAPPTLEYHSKVVPPKPAPVQPLDDGSAEAMAALFIFGRRMCFAIGMSMLGYGLGGGGQYASTMGWGCFLMGLCIPLGGK
jgi:hypothetical protein